MRGAVGDIRFGHAETLQILQRQVNALFLPIDGDILQEIDQLQGRADRIRIAQVLRIPEGTVKSRIRAGLLRLRAALIDEGVRK